MASGRTFVMDAAEIVSLLSSAVVSIVKSKNERRALSERYYRQYKRKLEAFVYENVPPVDAIT